MDAKRMRKAVGGTVLMGALGAASLGMAGAASASPTQYHKPTVTYSYQSTTIKKTVVVRDNGQVGNGNTTQSASGNAGAISNPQIGVGLNVGAQVPLGVSVLTQKGSGVDQDTHLRQEAGSNYSNNSTSVNTSAENGNNSSVSIGN